MAGYPYGMPMEKNYTINLWNKIYAVKITDDPEFKKSEPHLLFEREIGTGGGGRNWDIHPDGKRFVMIKGGEKKPNRMNVVINWFEQLKRLAPVH